MWYVLLLVWRRGYELAIDEMMMTAADAFKKIMVVTYLSSAVSVPSRQRPSLSMVTTSRPSLVHPIRAHADCSIEWRPMLLPAVALRIISMLAWRLGAECPGLQVSVGCVQRFRPCHDQSFPGQSDSHLPPLGRTACQLAAASRPTCSRRARKSSAPSICLPSKVMVPLSRGCRPTRLRRGGFPAAGGAVQAKARSASGRSLPP